MTNCPTCEYHKQRAQLWRDEAYRLAGHRLPHSADVGDLVYIHDSFGLPKDLFAIVTKRKHATPAFDERYPPVQVEVLVLAEKEKTCSWYEPQHLTVLERGYA
jgi:hypothetical protein